MPGSSTGGRVAFEITKVIPQVHRGPWRRRGLHDWPGHVRPLRGRPARGVGDGGREGAPGLILRRDAGRDWVIRIQGKHAHVLPGDAREARRRIQIFF